MTTDTGNRNRRTDQALRRVRRRRRISTCRSRSAPSCRCWARTAPARRPRCGCWRRCCAPTPGSAACGGYDVVARRAGARADLADRPVRRARQEPHRAREPRAHGARLRGRDRRGPPPVSRRADRAVRRSASSATGWSRTSPAASAGGSTSPPGLIDTPARARARRADHRPRSAQPSGRVVDDPRAGRATGSRCCSPPSTSRRPMRWPTASC